MEVGGGLFYYLTIMQD